MPENEIKLKPCPFCGGEAYILKSFSTAEKYHVCCGNTNCIIYVGGAWKKQKRQAAEAWNRRVDDAN